MKKQIIVPESKSDIKLKDFIKFQSLLGKDNDEDFINQKILEIFYDISYEEYRSMALNDYNYLIETLYSTLNKKAEFKRIITINDIEYGFIPKLDSMTTGELIDCDNYLKNEDHISLISILYRPIIEKKGDKYLIEQYKDNNSEIFKDIDLETYEGMIGFFFRLLSQLELIIQKYLEKELKKMEKKKMNLTEEQMKIFHENLNLVKNGLPTFNFCGKYLEEIY